MFELFSLILLPVMDDFQNMQPTNNQKIILGKGDQTSTSTISLLLLSDFSSSTNKVEGTCSSDRGLKIRCKEKNLV